MGVVIDLITLYGAVMVISLFAIMGALVLRRYHIIPAFIFVVMSYTSFCLGMYGLTKVFAGLAITSAGVSIAIEVVRMTRRGRRS